MSDSIGEWYRSTVSIGPSSSRGEPIEEVELIWADESGSSGNKNRNSCLDKGLDKGFIDLRPKKANQPFRWRPGYKVDRMAGQLEKNKIF